MYTEFAILIIISLAPIAILLWYFDSMDKVHKESRRFLWSIFLWGVLVTFVAGAVEVFLEGNLIGFIPDPYLQLFVSAFIFVALIEEGLKFWVVMKKAYGHPAFNEYYDGVIYAVVASLGFAALENIFYVTDGGLGVGIIRSILSVPAHALFGATMGYYIGMAKFAGNKNKEQRFLLNALLMAILLHGTYDFLLMTNSIYAMFVFPLLLGLYMNVKRKINYLHVLDNSDVPLNPLRIIDYVKMFFGMIFFTFGAMILFLVIVYLTGDVNAKAALGGNELDITYSTILGLLMMFLAAIIISWKAFKKGWMKFAHGLGVVNTTILLSIVYFIFVGVYAIIANIIKIIALPFKKKPGSYWSLKEENLELESFKHPF